VRRLKDQRLDLEFLEPLDLIAYPANRDGWPKTLLRNEEARKKLVRE